MSAATRWWGYDDHQVASNISASYHVLLTVEAMDRTPVSVHHLLPIVTLGRPLDRDIQFGASVRNTDGIYYYTSFPPLGFVAPWVFFHVTHLSVTIPHLMLFNFAIHLVATLLMALVVAEAVAALGVGHAVYLAIVMAAAASYLFTFEAYYSHGLVYWHHSLFQIAWLVQLLMIGRILRRGTLGDGPTRADVIILLVSSVLGPATEWTGYIANAAIAGILWWQPEGPARRRARWLAMGVVAAAAVAGIAFIIQFVSVVGFMPLLNALRERAEARSVVHAWFPGLADGYVESFGAMLLLVAGVVATYVITVRQRLPRWLVGLLLAATLPLIENVLLGEHAMTYHFDRLKALVTMIAVCGVLVALLPAHIQRRALFGWVAVLAWNVTHFPTRRFTTTVPPLATNDAFMRRLHATARPCAIYATNRLPRGWVELEFGANVYEGVPDLDSLRRLVIARGACQGFFVPIAFDAGESMYIWRRAVIYNALTGHVDTLDGTPRPRPRMAALAK